MTDTYYCPYFDLTVWTGDKGLEVYDEVHQNDMNALIHAVFLPFVFYGVMIALPALFPTTALVRKYIILSLNCMYISSYWYVGMQYWFDTLVWMAPATVLAIHTVTKMEQTQRCSTFFTGLCYMVAALTIQEVVGHMWFEEVPSRLTWSYVLNAIMYSPAFYVKYMTTVCPDWLSFFVSQCSVYLFASEMLP